MAQEQSEGELNRTNASAVALRLLGEHFDHVQILATWNEEGTTQRHFTGSGNWYARQGMAHDFISWDKAQTAADEISKVLPKPDDDGENWKSE